MAEDAVVSEGHTARGERRGCTGSRGLGSSPPPLTHSMSSSPPAPEAAETQGALLASLKWQFSASMAEGEKNANESALIPANPSAAVSSETPVKYAIASCPKPSTSGDGARVGRGASSSASLGVGAGVAAPHSHRSDGQFGGDALQFAVHHASVACGEIAWQASSSATGASADCPRLTAKAHTHAAPSNFIVKAAKALEARVPWVRVVWPGRRKIRFRCDVITHPRMSTLAAVRNARTRVVVVA